MGDVLVINGSYQPIRIISWQRAIVLWYRGKAEVIENYGNCLLHSQRLTIPKPAVIRLLAYFRGVDHLLHSAPPFSKKNVYERDQGFCQYCGKRIRMDAMTLDHVVPRAQGGKREWENLVTCCRTCNTQKANRTPRQAGMNLRKHPIKPSAHILFFLSGTRHIPHPSWETYLYPA